MVMVHGLGQFIENGLQQQLIVAAKCVLSSRINVIFPSKELSYGLPRSILLPYKDGRSQGWPHSFIVHTSKIILMDY